MLEIFLIEDLIEYLFKSCFVPIYISKYIICVLTIKLLHVYVYVYLLLFLIILNYILCIIYILCLYNIYLYNLIYYALYTIITMMLRRSNFIISTYSNDRFYCITCSHIRHYKQFTDSYLHHFPL